MNVFVILALLLAVSVTDADRCDTDVHPILRTKGKCIETKACTSSGGVYLHNWCMSEKTSIKCCFHEEEEKEEPLSDDCVLPEFEDPCPEANKGTFAHSDPQKYVKCINGKQIVLNCEVGTEWNGLFKVCAPVEEIEDADYDNLYAWLKWSLDEEEKSKMICGLTAHSQFGFGECVEESQCGGVFVSEGCGSSSKKCCFKNYNWNTICNLGGQLYPHPIPTKFIHCAHGWPVVKDCPVGQRWISEHQWCDFA